MPSAVVFIYFCACCCCVKDATVGCSMSCFQCVKRSSAAIPGPEMFGPVLNGRYYKWRGLFFCIFQMYLSGSAVGAATEQEHLLPGSSTTIMTPTQLHVSVQTQQSLSKQLRPMTPKSVFVLSKMESRPTPIQAEVTKCSDAIKASVH